MKKNASLWASQWCLLMSTMLLMGLLLTARAYVQNHASEINTPVHQNSQDQQENDSNSNDDPEADDENDSVVMETEFLLWPPSLFKQNLSIAVNSYKEYHLQIIAPPPRS